MKIQEYPKRYSAFLWHFIKRQFPYFALLQLLAFAWSFDNVVWPYMLKLIIDKITLFSTDKSHIWHQLMPILIVAGSMWILIDLGYRAFGFLGAKIIPRFEADLRLSMFEYVQQHSYDYFANHFSGNISNRISDMVSSSTRILQLIMTLFLPALAALISASIIFATINPWFASLLICWTVLHIGICLAGTKRCAEASRVHSDARSFLTGKIVDSLSNIISVKLFAKQGREYEYVKEFQVDEQTKHTRALFIAEKLRVALTISAFIFPGILLTWYVIYNWQHDLITLGGLVLIFNTTWNIQHLAWFAGHELPNLYKEIGTCEQAMELIRAEHDIQDHPEAHLLDVQQGEIQFNSVNFNYQKDKPVFENLTLTIKPGSKVGLVGYSGSGKSTFVNLIFRFFDINSGSINIDGQAISHVMLQSLRAQISMIPQEPSLFHRTIRENICYGNKTASDDEMIQAAKQANCHEFIMQLQNGYDSLVGERGIKLSGGQRQRIAIARAILENAPILILDEATSALDSVTEKRIQESLHYLMSGKTTIVIAHRLSTLSEMDRILVFDNGNIIEDGTHNDLLAIDGHYSNMWKMQAGGFLPDKPKD